LLLTAWSVFALLVWASPVVGSTARTTFLTIIGVITVGGFFAPVITGASGLTAPLLCSTPCTSPPRIAGRFFRGQAEWWAGPTVVVVFTVGGVFAPVMLGASGLSAKILSWAPFASPRGIAGRFFGGQAEWWEGLVAARTALVRAVILPALASGAYVRSVLRCG